MNSLLNLIHESLVATGHVECAAIIRRKDSSIRATSVGYTVSVLIYGRVYSACAYLIHSQARSKSKPSLQHLRTHRKLENMVFTLMELLTLVLELTRIPSMLKRCVFLLLASRVASRSVSFLKILSPAWPDHFFSFTWGR